MTQRPDLSAVPGPKGSDTDNYEQTKARVGYVPRSSASRELYSDLGFMCGLEIHQQLLTRQKLFCHCPAGIYQKEDEYDA